MFSLIEHVGQGAADVSKCSAGELCLSSAWVELIRLFGPCLGCDHLRLLTESLEGSPLDPLNIVGEFLSTFRGLGSSSALYFSKFLPSLFSVFICGVCTCVCVSVGVLFRCVYKCAHGQNLEVTMAYPPRSFSSLFF